MHDHFVFNRQRMNSAMSYCLLLNTLARKQPWAVFAHIFQDTLVWLLPVFSCNNMAVNCRVIQHSFTSGAFKAGSFCDSSKAPPHPPLCRRSFFLLPLPSPQLKQRNLNLMTVGMGLPAHETSSRTSFSVDCFMMALVPAMREFEL